MDKFVNKYRQHVTFALLAVIAFALVTLAVAAVFIAVDVHSFVNGNAWDAPWLNVITRGPVQ